MTGPARRKRGRRCAGVPAAKDGSTDSVALNFTATLRTASFNIGGAQATILLSSFSKAGQSVSLNNLALPGYGAFVGRVR
jgi:hypothetical protein